MVRLKKWECGSSLLPRWPGPWQSGRLSAPCNAPPTLDTGRDTVFGSSCLPQ